MAAGFEVYAENGSLLINSNMIGWFCAASGVGQTQVKPPASGNTTVSVASINVSGRTMPLTAIRIHGDSYAAARFSSELNGVQIYTTDAPVGHNFTWYVYDYAPRLPAINNGLETYREDGQRSFSSAYMPFKPLAQIGDMYRPGYEMAICGPSVAGYGRIQGGENGISYYVRDQNGTFVRVEPDASPTHYRYIRDCKLWGGQVIGPDRALRRVVTFDDVDIGYLQLPVNRLDWQVDAPVLAVDVTRIPVPGNFF